MKVFYHGDDDGKCAAFWVKHLAQHIDKYPREFIEMQYGKEFPMQSIQHEEQVYIVDYSIDTWLMYELLTRTPNVTWIDHHITAIEKYQDFKEPIRGIRYDGVAGCMLTYCYLKYMTNHGEGNESPFQLSMKDDAPMFTKLIADYDVWTFDYGITTSNFHMGFQLQEKHPESEVWEMLLRGAEDFSPKGDLVDQVILDGMVLLDYQAIESQHYCEAFGYEVEFEGYRCFVMNRGMIGSDHFSSQNDQGYDMYIGWVYDGNKYRYSLRSETIDVSKVAMKYSGGGHKGAAGFTSTEFLLKGSES